ncbi:neuromedin-U receptor 1 [Amyelois transitella]|uniref:neuromedin-U receptor 1 n=1 Tax=Amyelois transitella TaxID=680683 RepID=UPI00298FED05|nr:neuromedin-U receptor 1 [Amyelois transitella]
MEFFQSVEKTDSLIVVYVVLMMIIFVTGTAGNVVTCVVIYSDRSMHTATNYYLFNLAVSDLIALFTIFLDVCYYSDLLSISSDSVGNIICKLECYTVGVLWNNGVLILTVLAIERYFAIKHPLAVKRGGARRRVAYVMAGVWSAALLETLPDLFVVRLMRTRSGPVCFVPVSRYNQLASAAAAVCGFLLPLAIMVYVYVVIALTVNARDRSSCEDNVFDRRNSKKKVNKHIMALTLSFLACWLPYCGFRMVYALGEPRLLVALAQHWQAWFMAVSLGAWVSSVLNPLLFSLASSKFRKALKKLWHTKFMRRTNTRMERVPAWSPVDTHR